MPAAVEFRASIVGRFNDLLMVELQKRGDAPVSARDLRVAVIDECLQVAEPYYRELVEAKVDQQAGWLLQRTRPAKAEALPTLIPGLDLPFRIPTRGAWGDADDVRQQWVPLHNATVADLRHHKSKIDHEMQLKTRYQDAINLLFATVIARCDGDETRTVGEVLADEC
jgi:hypothetical protein